MESLRELYKIGPGPSSSHTIGPKLAAEAFQQAFPNADAFRVVLYGSLALTGRGHLSDKIIEKTFAPVASSVIFDTTFLKKHPNGMDFFAYSQQKLLGKWRVYSIGGGSILVDGNKQEVAKKIYPEKNLREIMAYIQKNDMDFVDYVDHYEKEVFVYLKHVLATMFACVEKGLEAEGIIPGRLQLEKVAARLYTNTMNMEFNAANSSERTKMLVSAYAYAVSEENASGGEVVTAPTCGAAGVLPAVLYYFHHHQNIDEARLINALAVAGVFGNVVKTNATISGAKGGCQAEIGTACSMAAAAAAYLLKLDLQQIEYAAEVAMEHHLGLTCDPVGGYVQIPCIERNGAAALRAYDAALYGKHIAILRKNRISFDDVVQVMKETGKHLHKDYKETSLGGLAKHHQHKLKS